jgi:acetyltransferase-like isoleucine patch superfamily enzyme
MSKNKITILKHLIFSNPIFLKLISFFYNFRNVYKINCSKSNRLSYSGAFLKKTSVRVNGSKNSILISNATVLNNCHIYVSGNFNILDIGEHCNLKDVELHVEDNNNRIYIGNHTTIGGKTHIACIEGTIIRIGKDCMFSKDIVFRTGDSHSIIDENGKRTNPSQDIIIGNHVWVGNNVIVTKGSIVGDNSIIGTGSIVTNVFKNANLIIAGSPAKIVKENINWLRERI